ncbi:MAG: hypothetical protein DRQ55_09595 [Planctomycetota bacterium]|nr:MAG: hypothetical protein DRQ55_09595 [Planctomycetota bacterium]
MTRAERSFVLGTALCTLAVPGALLALRPFSELRAELGILLGWALALVVIVPSFWVMARAMASDDRLAFQRAFMLGTMGRFGGSLLAIVLFSTQLNEPPTLSFLASFFAGYALLSGLEVTLLLKKTPDGTHA